MGLQRRRNPCSRSDLPATGSVRLAPLARLARYVSVWFRAALTCQNGKSSTGSKMSKQKARRRMEHQFRATSKATPANATIVPIQPRTLVFSPRKIADNGINSNGGVAMMVDAIPTRVCWMAI